jgi:class 3 adenylate cyclase
MVTCSRCGQESPEGFAFCGSCGAPLSHEDPIREVRKTVTIVFSDVTGSTALGEQLDPESLRRVMSRYAGCWASAQRKCIVTRGRLGEARTFLDQALDARRQKGILIGREWMQALSAEL